jgi:hypothetical protein
MSTSLCQPEVPEGANDVLGEGARGAEQRKKKRPKLAKKEWKRLRREEMEAALGTGSPEEMEAALGTGSLDDGDGENGHGGAATSPMVLPWATRWEVRQVLPLNVGGLATYLFDMRKC